MPLLIFLPLKFLSPPLYIHASLTMFWYINFLLGTISSPPETGIEPVVRTSFSSSIWWYEPALPGNANRGIRTLGHKIKSPALYRLSYVGGAICGVRTHAYEYSGA